jgi:hypothetical protein
MHHTAGQAANRFPSLVLKLVLGGGSEGIVLLSFLLSDQDEVWIPRPADAQSRL